MPKIMNSANFDCVHVSKEYKDQRTLNLLDTGMYCQMLIVACTSIHIFYIWELCASREFRWSLTDLDQPITPESRHPTRSVLKMLA